MTHKQIGFRINGELRYDYSLEDIAERIEFIAAVQTGLDQLDRDEGIPHDDVKKQLPLWLKLPDDLHK